MTTPDLRALAADLRRTIDGEVATDDVTRAVYATDASNYQVLPLAVVTPRTDDDVRAAVAAARRHGAAILPRGGGTSLAGQAVGEAVVIDFSRHLDALVQLDADAGWARVQPGIVRDELNAQLAPHGLHFSPDPATADRANVGGMIGNNSSGTRSIVYGKTIDHVLETRVLLADGTELTFGPLERDAWLAKERAEGREGEIHREVRRIVEANREEIAARYPKVMRRVAGYNLDAFVEGRPWNLSHLVAGSEGTLATLLEAKIHLDPIPAARALAVVHFPSVLDALGAVPWILGHGPSAVEILDRIVLSLARQHPTIARSMGFVSGEPEAVLLVEVLGGSEAEARARIDAFAAAAGEAGVGIHVAAIHDAAQQAGVWWVRKNGLGIMLSMKGDRKPIPFIEDAAIPVDTLREYIEEIQALCRRQGVDVALYAHASVGVIHVRPILDLKENADVERMRTIADGAFELVRKHGGSWSGEHGDGRVRSPFLEAFFGPRLFGAFREIKRLFDPENRMNPGVIVDPAPMETNLRFGPSYDAPALETVYRYREDGSFGAAVEMCTGIGACRRRLSGTMCPSFRATRDEVHTTRGRANVLRLAMSGQLGAGALSGDGVFEALDLCLSCKACKSECPSRVDMAKLKGEVLQMRWDRHGPRLRDRMVSGAPDAAARFAGPMAPIVNRALGTGLVRGALARAVGIDARRRLPSFAREPLHRWFAKRGRGLVSPRRVALFADTFVDYHEPDVGRAAVHLLETCGYEVVLARAGCCQRPRISHGFLRDARDRGEATLQALDAYVREELPILVVEPSCASALVDDLPDLVEDAALGRRVAEAVRPIERFLAEELEAGRIEHGLETIEAHRREPDAAPHVVAFHGHCHQKALFGTSALRAVLERTAGVEVREIEAGCCGMAGAFGYESEHYELSRKIGEDRLFPAVRALGQDAALVACGFSCRHQIADMTGVSGRHLVEIVRGREPRNGT